MPIQYLDSHTMQQQSAALSEAEFHPTVDRANYTFGGGLLFVGFALSVFILLAVPEFVFGVIVGTAVVNVLPLP